jgi:hypothetical protein
MRFKYQATYDKKLDNFQVEYLLVGSLAMGLLTTYDFTIIEVKKKKKKKKKKVWKAFIKKYLF